MVKGDALTEQFYARAKRGYSRCLWPTMKCPNKAINAHSVQRATALALIAEKGKVMELRSKIVEGQLRSRFECRGLRQASTFTGLCAEHDATVFRSIDTQPLDFNNPAQMFLIAWRSVTREVHATMAGADNLQNALRTAVEDGRVSPDEGSPLFWATRALMRAYVTHCYRTDYYDRVFASGRFGDILHSVVPIKERQPVLASSSFFAVDDRRLERDLPRLVLNVIPSSQEETTVIFSYPRTHADSCIERIQPILQSCGENQLLALSTMILDATENFFVRPSHVAGWPDQKRMRIEEAFRSTVTQDADLQPANDLMLF